MDDIHVLEASRLATLGTERTHFHQCEKGSMQPISVESLDLVQVPHESRTLSTMKRKFPVGEADRRLVSKRLFEIAFWVAWSI